MRVANGELILGQATVIIDDIHGHRETKCDMIACGDTASRYLRRLIGKLVRKYGALGLAALAALMSAQNPNFDATQHMPMVIGAITSAISTSFKTELATATHNFTNSTGDVFKCAMFVSAATLGAATTAYSSTNELSGTGYTAGGTTITSSTPVASGTTIIYDFTDAQWTTATWSTANGCLVYNSSKSNKAVFVIAFGSDQSVTAGTFTIQWPSADASNAIMRCT